ncbi:cation:proton antiporter [Methanococcus voltae]|uniref:Uncharacterized protein n=1 Tax=Methanococcus voltae (strain ATCC BAA-1334 / A3) TaxID=456320 RepID=D7DTR0_METV3|nr:cation:proton antiporter [Methanococcus voltae]
MFDFLLIRDFLQNLVLTLVSLGILIASIKLWTQRDISKNIVYARLHIVGIVDISCIVILFMFNQPLLALVYLILSPFSAHAIANANYNDEISN